MRTSSTVPIRRVFNTQIKTRPIHPVHHPISPSISQLLSQPTWSVRSLLPPPTTQQTPSSITKSQLHHLLNLSALPLPTHPEAETRMLATLDSQIHFVRAVQSVDTTNIEPLITIRDETEDAVAEQTITLEKMRPYLALEEKVGRNGTVRRRDVVRTRDEDRRERAGWEVDVADLGAGSERRRMGRWFYVRRKRKDVEEREEKVGGT